MADEIRDIIRMQSSQTKTSEAEAEAAITGREKSDHAQVAREGTNAKNAERTSALVPAKNKEDYRPEKPREPPFEQVVTSHPDDLSVFSPTSEMAQIGTGKRSEDLDTPGYPCITVHSFQADDTHHDPFAPWLQNDGQITATPSQMLPEIEIQQDMVLDRQMLALEEHSYASIIQRRAKTPEAFCNDSSSAVLSTPQSQDCRDDIFSSTSRKSSSLTILSLGETIRFSELARSQNKCPPEEPLALGKDIEDSQTKAIHNPQTGECKEGESLDTPQSTASPTETETEVQVEIFTSPEQRAAVESREKGDPSRILEPPVSSDDSQHGPQVKLTRAQNKQHPSQSLKRANILSIAESTVPSEIVQTEVRVTLEAEGERRPDIESVSTSTLTSKPTGGTPYSVSDLITDAIRDMRLLHCQEEVPDTTLAKVFAVLQPRLDEASAYPECAWTSNQWCHILRQCESKSKVKSMKYLASCMAAAGSYDAEVETELAQSRPTRGNGKKMAATRVLVRWLSENSNEDIGNALDGDSALSSIMEREKRALLNNLSRGRKLARLVGILKFGVLFGSKTW